MESRRGGQETSLSHSVCLCLSLSLVSARQVLVRVESTRTARRATQAELERGTRIRGLHSLGGRRRGRHCQAAFVPNSQPPRLQGWGNGWLGWWMDIWAREERGTWGSPATRYGDRLTFYGCTNNHTGDASGWDWT